METLAQLYSIDENNLSFFIDKKPVTISTLPLVKTSRGMEISEEYDFSSLKTCMSFVKNNDFFHKITLKKEPLFDIWLELIKKYFWFDADYILKDNEYYIFTLDKKGSENYYNFILLRMFYSNIYVFIVDRLLYHYIHNENEKNTNNMLLEMWQILIFMMFEQHKLSSKKYKNALNDIYKSSNILRMYDYYGFDYISYFSFFILSEDYKKHYKKNTFLDIDLDELIQSVKKYKSEKEASSISLNAVFKMEDFIKSENILKPGRYKKFLTLILNDNKSMTSKILRDALNLHYLLNFKKNNTLQQSFNIVSNNRSVHFFIIRVNTDYIEIKTICTFLSQRENFSKKYKI